MLQGRSEYGPPFLVAQLAGPGRIGTTSPRLAAAEPPGLGPPAGSDGPSGPAHDRPVGSVRDRRLSPDRGGWHRGRRLGHATARRGLVVPTRPGPASCATRSIK